MPHSDPALAHGTCLDLGKGTSNIAPLQPAAEARSRGPTTLSVTFGSDAPRSGSTQFRLGRAETVESPQKKSPCVNRGRRSAKASAATRFVLLGLSVKASSLPKGNHPHAKRTPLRQRLRRTPRQPRPSHHPFLEQPSRAPDATSLATRDRWAHLSPGSVPRPGYALCAPLPTPPAST